uniref:Nucleoside-diphosphatase mig-23 n=1 Tax=Globodera pallida TaxID=36090 RepID=A0A183C0I1_GLOPA
MDKSYGIVIDAGSTGSRLFLYSWTSPSTDELISISAVNDRQERPVVKKVTPGLSSFGDKPEAASAYIKPLLDFAAEFIPEQKLGATPVFIFATAGMRLLSLEKQQNVMENLRKELPRMTKLQILNQHIQKAFTKKRLSTSSVWERVQRPNSAGMIDMGGASAQIAYELPFADSEGGTLPKSGENVQLINLGCRDDDPRFRYRLFVTTFLGFGVNEGAKTYEKFLWKRLSGERPMNSTEDAKTKVPTVVDGCLPLNLLKLTYVEENYSQFGNGDWDTCVSDIATLLFESNSKCPLAKSCFFDGIQAPSKLSLSKVELYGFSEYWFSVDDVLSLGGKYEHDKFERKAKEFCGQSWAVIKKKVKTQFYPKADSERLETQCFKSAWIHAVLHNGFHVDEVQHHFQSAFRINGQEVQWVKMLYFAISEISSLAKALGAIIYQMRYFPLLTENTGRRSMSPKSATGDGKKIQQT